MFGLIIEDESITAFDKLLIQLSNNSGGSALVPGLLNVKSGETKSVEPDVKFNFVTPLLLIMLLKNFGDTLAFGDEALGELGLLVNSGAIE